MLENRLASLVKPCNQELLGYIMVSCLTTVDDESLQLAQFFCAKQELPYGGIRALAFEEE
ncbi:hypothetical protein NPIL_613441, partial [Nephila pilipes]